MYSHISEGDDFSRRVTAEFFREANRRHRKFPLVRRYEYGIALNKLRPGFEHYWAALQASARRNCKKATRLGYSVDRITFNDHLGDVTQILRSSTTRQGRPMPERLLRDGASPAEIPKVRSTYHDYPYFGVVRDGRLLAYAGCFVAGELCEIQTIYGHADHQADGIIPLLIVNIVERLNREYPAVRYFSFGSYFGATETMRRFKRKFHFHPHRVTWRLDS